MIYFYTVILSLPLIQEGQWPVSGKRMSTSTGPSCSKLMTSLVNDSLKLRLSDMQICRNFLLKKCE